MDELKDKFTVYTNRVQLYIIRILILYGHQYSI